MIEDRRFADGWQTVAIGGSRLTPRKREENESVEVKRNFFSNMSNTLTVSPIVPIGPRSPV